MMFDLQDAEKNANFITNRNIEQPMLLDGIQLDSKACEEAELADKAGANKGFLEEHEFDAGVGEGTKKKLEQLKSQEMQTLFREKQVENLNDIIYGKKTQHQPASFGFDEPMLAGSTGESEVYQETIELTLDCYRFDTNPKKLERYHRKSYKKLLKKKFVTGISKDKVMENILNMEDSDGEAHDEAGNIVTKEQQEQLRKMDENTKKGSKEDKKRKRLLNKGIKVDTDSDEASEDIDEASGDEEKTGIFKKADKKKEMEKQKELEKGHKPIKKSNDEIKKSQFLGEKYGHYKIGTYVRIEI